MVQLLLNHELRRVLGLAIASVRHRLFIATADLKNVQMPIASQAGHRGARSILSLLEELARRGVEVRLLHSGIPSGPFLQELKRCRTSRVAIRRCCRVHTKAVIIDGRLMYLGSANLTGAGLGAKGPRRRNFEAGIITDDLALIDPMSDMLETIWSGVQCQQCGRKQFCPLPLEEPGPLRKATSAMPDLNSLLG